ncbi:hypothetical protein [Sorangium sp. So ce1024]|uniref:hypothetical protein n=1 Tax=Sorangium sp. So ce1024 TaxID=3133327 RepID=UPI003F0DE038
MPDAEERLTLATCALVAGCILLAPREWISAGIALTLAAALFVWHLRLRGPAPPKSPAAGAAGAGAPGASAGASGAPGAPAEAGRSSGEPREASAQPRLGDERRESA